MKKTLTLLALVALGIVAMGCDPAPKDQPAAATSAPADAKTAAPDNAKTDK